MSISYQHYFKYIWKVDRIMRRNGNLYSLGDSNTAFWKMRALVDKTISNDIEVQNNIFINLDWMNTQRTLYLSFKYIFSCKYGTFPKTGRRPQQTFLQRKYTDCQQTHERMLNSTNHQRNANQNYNELSPHTSQNGHYQKFQKQ